MQVIFKIIWIFKVLVHVSKAWWISNKTKSWKWKFVSWIVNVQVYFPKTLLVPFLFTKQKILILIHVLITNWLNCSYLPEAYLHARQHQFPPIIINTTELKYQVNHRQLDHIALFTCGIYFWMWDFILEENGLFKVFENKNQPSIW